MNRRIMAVLAALVLAAIGTAAVFLYVHGADQRALDKTKAVSVYVAARQVPSGTSLQNAVNSGMLTEKQFPAVAVPVGALTQISSGDGVLVADADIQPGELVLSSMFAASASLNTPLQIPAGKVAVSVQLDVTRAVASFVQPGTQIAVFATFNGDNQGKPAVGKDNPVTRMLLPRVNVLQVGQFTANGQTAQSGGNVIATLAVTQAQAEQLIQAQTVGTLYLALLGSGSTTGPDNGLDGSHLFG